MGRYWNLVWAHHSDSFAIDLQCSAPHVFQRSILIFISMKQNINHSKLRKLVNLIVEQEDSDDFYRITPEEYIQLLDFSDNSPGFTKIKKFKLILFKTENL